jgi:hypothetical protein
MVKARSGSLPAEISAHTPAAEKAKIQPTASVTLPDKRFTGLIESKSRMQKLKFIYSLGVNALLKQTIIKLQFELI